MVEIKNDYSNRTNEKNWFFGIFLTGIKGCGKSVIIRAISNEFELPLYRLNLDKLRFESIEVVERSFKKILDVISRLSPICLWLDEVEKAFEFGDKKDNKRYNDVTINFLKGIREKNKNTFLAATTNNPLKLPQEILSKMYFDHVYFLDLPNPKEREEILTTKPLAILNLFETEAVRKWWDENGLSD